MAGETGLQYHGEMIGMTHAKTTGASDKALVHLSPASYAIYRTVGGPFEMPQRRGPGSIVRTCERRVGCLGARLDPLQTRTLNPNHSSILRTKHSSTFLRYEAEENHLEFVSR